VAGWLNQFWDTLKAVSLPLVVLGLSFQLLQTLFISLAWRNILRAAYPKSVLPYREVLSYYAGGAGLNSILPASAGTVAMLGLYRSAIAGSTVAGLVGATLVQNIFFVVVAAVIYLWLFLSVTGSFDVQFGWFSSHVALSLIIFIGGGLLTVIVGKLLWHRLRHTWEQAKDGGGILTTPRKFMTQVVLVEAASYAARMGVNATFMYAYHIPVSITNIFLIVAASSISSTIAIAPGAVGTQTALISVVLNGVAPQSVITAYTVGQAVITTAWSVAFGLTMLAMQIGWKQTRSLIHFRKKKDGNAEPLAEPLAAEAGPPDATG
jgi:uncharacterized membrane protein YbhN (UPF0104 family)